MYDISFRGVKGSSLGVLAERRVDLPAPSYAREDLIIPGRDGIIQGETRLEKLEIPVEFNFMASKPDMWNADFRTIKAWLLGKTGRLELSDDEDYYFKVYYVDITDPERPSRRIGRFTAVFTCEPYMYLKKGEREYTVDQVEFNPYETAHPTYILRGYSEGTVLTVNGFTLEMSVDGTLIIDTDRQQAYDEAGNLRNTSVIGDYASLYLQNGQNQLSVSTGGLTVIPNWRSL